MKPMSDHEFDLYRKLVYGQSGIALNSSKKALLEARLGRRLRELGMESFRAYYEYVTADLSGGELIRLLDRISTNETHFFREPKQFQFLEHRVLPIWTSQAQSGQRSWQLRAWSAGCSTGEEPYSLAMVLLDLLPPATGWEIEIIATDLSSRALATAQKAVWPIGKTKEIPEKYLKRFMLKGTGSQSGYIKAGPELRSLIHFQRLNLNDENFMVSGFFDLIFCRNILIYFDAESRARVVHRLVNRLALAGYLFVGHAESLTAISDQVRPIVPTVYHHAPANSTTEKVASGLTCALGTAH